MTESNHTRQTRRRLLGSVSALSALSVAATPWSVARAMTAASDGRPVAGSDRSVSLQRRPRLVLAGPAASVSNPLIHMVESGALANVADQVEFRQWNNPDQLRALAMGGDADVIAVPTNVAANLYNRGVPLTLINVAVWGILWMVSRQDGKQSLADFKGEEIAIPFRADMPDILFGFLAEQQGLDSRRDFRLRYTATPMDAVQLLVMHQVDHALLAEPAVSMVLRKTRSFPLSIAAPELHRSVDLQQEWGRLLQREPRIPQAGVAALGELAQDAGLMAYIEQAYAASHVWCAENAQECGRMVVRHIPMLTPLAVADSLQVIPRYYATATQARAELDYFYSLLSERQPAVVGGKVPDAGFYGEAAV